MPATPNTWDSPPAVLSWDSLAPDATWDSSATPTPKPKPKPKPKKKPFRRKAKPTPPQPPTPTHTMPTFKYNVAPLSSGGFYTRAARGEIIDEAAMLAAIGTATGVTAAEAEAVIKAFFNQLLLSAADNDWSPELLGLISFRGTSGGSQPQPTDFHNADDINADVALTFTSAVIDQWRATLTLESLGEVGKLTPVIETIIRQSDKAVDKYTALGLCQARGDYMNLDPADLTQGIFLKAGAAAEVRVTEYASISPHSIVFLVPAGLSGSLQVRIATFINGSVRSYTYTNVITTP